MHIDSNLDSQYDSQAAEDAGSEQELAASSKPIVSDKPKPTDSLPAWMNWLIVILVPLCICVAFCAPAARQQTTKMAAPSAISGTELSGMHQADDGSYVIDSDDASMTIDFENSFDFDTITIPLTPQDDSQKTAWQKIGFDAGDILTVSVSSRVAGESDYTAPYIQTLLSDNPQSETLLARPTADQIDSIRISFPDSHEGDSFSLSDDISFNQNIPVTPYWLFMLIVGLIAVFACLCRPSAMLTRYAWQNHKAARYIVAITCCLMLCVASVGAVYVGGSQDENSYFDAFNAINDPNQYQHVTDSMLEGHAYLDEQVPGWLAAADNPYDYDYRHDTSDEKDEPYLFDYAYHDGHYYSYDGILPVLVFFLPYRLIVSLNASNEIAMSVMACVATAVSMFLASSIIKHYRRDASISEHMIAWIAMWLCSCVLWLAFYPTVYHEAIIVGLTAAESGIGLWFCADGYKDSKEPVKKPQLVCGSLLVGATILARPMLVLAAFLAFPIFGHRFIHRKGSEREFFGLSKVATVNTLCVFIPIIICVGIAMFWNYARFGSVLDFGYKYNLTGFDMTTKEDSLDRTLFGLFMYFIAPLNIRHAYPFFMNDYTRFAWYINMTNNIPGIIQEPYYGGLFAFFPFIAYCFVGLGRLTRQILHEHHNGMLIACSLVLMVLIATFDSLTAVTQRYLADFAWLGCIAALLVFCEHENAIDRENRKALTVQYRSIGKYVFLLLVIISLVLVMVNLLASDRYNSLNINNPQVWWSCWSWFLDIY